MIDDILKQVRNGDMPQNDWGKKKPLDSDLRSLLLASGETLRKLLTEADQWQQSNPRHP